MTKDLKNKLNTFIILTFGCVLLLTVSIYSDYKPAQSKLMDSYALKIQEMDLLNSKQADILIQMDTIEAKLKAYDPKATNSIQLSTEIDKCIHDLKDYLVKNSLGDNTFKGIVDNYYLMLKDKENLKMTTSKISDAQKQTEECKDHVAASTTELNDLKNSAKKNSND